jgi:tetratricopeptide (TPR) repeat protein
MSKFLTNFSLPISPIPEVQSNPFFLPQINAAAQAEEVRKALGIKTTEEKISDIIAQLEPLEKKSLNEIPSEELRKGAPDQDHENIVKILNQIIALDPETPWAHFHRGQSLFNLGKYEAAALDFTQELEREDGPRVYRSYFQRSWCHLEMNEIGLAVKDFDNYKKFDTSNEINRESVAELQLRIDGSLDELHENARLKLSEVESFEKLEISGLNRRVAAIPEKDWLDFINEEWKELGPAISDKYSKSLELFNQLVECAPEKRWSHYDRGLNLMKLDRYEEALLDFEKESEINQSEHCKKTCTYAKADVHYLLQDYEKAKLGFEHLLQIQGESQDQIFDSAKRRLKSLEREGKEKTYYSEYIVPAFSIFCASFVAVAVTHALLQQDNAIYRRASSNPYIDEKESKEFIESLARVIFDCAMVYDDLADHVVENFHRLPKNFFQIIVESDSTQDLTAFLDEQQFLDQDLKKALVENFFVQIKDCEKDKLPKPFNCDYTKNYLYDVLLKNRDSQNYEKDPERMANAIRYYEEELSRNFQKLCEDFLRHEKIKPLLEDLVSKVEESLTKPAKDSNAVKPEEILESSEAKTPSKSPSITTMAKPKSSQEKVNSDSFR